MLQIIAVQYRNAVKDENIIDQFPIHLICILVIGFKTNDAAIKAIYFIANIVSMSSIEI